MPPLRVLLLEDSEADAELIVGSLHRAHLRIHAQRVTGKPAFVEALAAFKPDAILCDHNDGGFGGVDALEQVRTVTPATPMIVVSDALDENGAVACLRAGAEDIILKNNLGRLAPAITNALAVRKKLRSLSPRQLQVLQLVAEANTTREIARKLKVGVKTAETHRAELMRRLGMHDVVSLVRFALRTGVVAPDPA